MGWPFGSINMDTWERRKVDEVKWDTCHMTMNFDYDPGKQARGTWLKRGW